MRYLIVNADDFGASCGINRAIVDLHHLGIVTSTSLMLGMTATDDAIRRAAQAPGLGVGLHAVLTREDGTPLLDFEDETACAAELNRQLETFASALGRLPSHLDSHQNVHRDERLLPIFQDVARTYRLPLREHSGVRYFSSFYGQWDGVPHPEQISIENLLGMLPGELEHGFVELSCHPGYVDEAFASPYNAERAIEMATLSDPRLAQYLSEADVALIRFSDAPIDALRGTA